MTRVLTLVSQLLAIKRLCACCQAMVPWYAALILIAGCRDTALVQEADEINVDDSHALFMAADPQIDAIRDVYIDNRQQLWVLSEFPPFLHIFDATGRLVRRFGAQGGGPTEMRMPWNFVGDSAGSVGVWDGGRRRVVRFTDEGTYVSELSIQLTSAPVMLGFRSYSFGEPVRLVQYSGGYVVDTYDGQVRRTMDLWRGRLLLLDESGATAASVPFAGLGHSAAREAGGDDVFRAVPLWTTCNNGDTYILSPDSSQIHRIASDGTLGAGIGVALPHQMLTADDMRRYAALRLEIVVREERKDTTDPAMKRAVESTIRDLIAQLPKDAPPVRMRCDALSRVWIELFSTDWDARGYSGTWIMWNNGRAQRVQFPPRFHAMYFGRNRVAGIAVDELDVETPMVYRYPTELHEMPGDTVEA